MVVLTLASMNPTLQSFVPDIEGLQEQAINNVQPWAFSSLEVVLNILGELQRKSRLLLRMNSQAL